MMDEWVWLTTNDPEMMLRWLNPYNARIGKVTDPDTSHLYTERKLQLYCYACCQLVLGSSITQWENQGGSGMNPQKWAESWSTNKKNVMQGSAIGKYKGDVDLLRANIFRQIVGNPFRHMPPMTLPMTPWHPYGDVRQIAQTIYDCKQWSDLPILRDALIEADITDIYLLNHLIGLEPCGWCLQATHGNEEACGGRGYGKYPAGYHGWLKNDIFVRGDWALDTILGQT